MKAGVGGTYSTDGEMTIAYFVMYKDLNRR